MAAPLGATAGAGLGFEAGLAILEFLGLVFLVKYIAEAFERGLKLAGQGAKLAWYSVGRPTAQRHVDMVSASRLFARAAAEVFRGILQGIVAFLLAKGTAAAASRVPELIGQLRTSRLGASFAEWVGKNWQALVDEPRLRPEPPSQPTVSSAGGGGKCTPPARPAEPAVTEEIAPPPKPAIKITEKGMDHVVERHTSGGPSKYAGKSKFSDGEDLTKLIQSGSDVPPTAQQNGNFARTYDVGRDIGFDRGTNGQTSTMTVITNADGELVTAFPGSP